MKTYDQIIYQKLGELLWSVMSPKDINIIFKGRIYSDHQDFQLLCETIEGCRYIEITNDLFFDLSKLMEDLNTCLIFDKEPWTQFKIILNEEGNFKINFAYISEQESWPGLYMRAISDLDQTELDEYNIPLEEWKRCVSSKKQKGSSNSL